MTVLKALLAVLLFAEIALAQASQQPSLGDVVRADKDSPKPKAVRVITEDELNRDRPLPAEADATEPAEAPADSDEAAAQPKSEQDEAIDRLSEEVKLLEADVEALKQKRPAEKDEGTPKAEGAPSANEEKSEAEDSTNASAIAELLSSRQAELENARQQLDELKKKAAEKPVVTAPAAAQDNTANPDDEEKPAEPGEPD